VEAIQDGEADVQQNQVWLERLRLSNSLQAVRGFAHNAPSRALLKLDAQAPTPPRVVVHYQHAELHSHSAAARNEPDVRCRDYELQ
jgi:hypothetical protein